MRRKALLAEASSPFVGPWVCLEEGTWEIQKPVGPSEVDLEIEGIDLKILLNGEAVRVLGPARVRGVVNFGTGVHLDATQLRR